MLKPDLAILEDVLLVTLPPAVLGRGRQMSGRLQKALLLAVWATEGSVVDLPSLGLAAGMERGQASYAAQMLVELGLVTRRRAPNHDGIGGGAPMVYSILRGNLAKYRGEWPRGRWPRPGLEGFGVPSLDHRRRAVEIRDDELRRAGIALDDLRRPGAGPWVKARRRIVAKLYGEGIGERMSVRQVGELLGIQRNAASRMVRQVVPSKSQGVAA